MIKKIIAGLVMYVIVSLLISGMTLPNIEPVDFDWVSHIINTHIGVAIMACILVVFSYCFNVIMGEG